MDEQNVNPLHLDFYPPKPVVVQRREQQLSQDAGLLPIRQLDQRWRYTRRLAACLGDHRRAPDHPTLTLLRQRLYGILADYADANDHQTLRHDPVFKLIADRSIHDPPLASQPTLSRFENAARSSELQQWVDFLIDTGVERLQHAHRGALPDQLTLDLDPTDDPCHGQQQLRLFHGYYDQHQYLPQIISEPTTQHVFLAWLRPGSMHAAKGADDDLMRVVNKLREGRSDMAVHVRGDADFGMPWMYDVCENNGLTYTFGLRGNPRLQREAQPLMDQAIEKYAETGQKQRRFRVFSYQADSWDQARTVIAKAECQAQGTNLRFVITNLPVHNADEAQRCYDDYIQRGTSEQRMDELKNGLHADRLSCHRFKANFLRLLMHTAAFNLLNALRDDAAIPAPLRRGQPGTWRSHLIKAAATVRESCRRIVIELAASWPFAPLYQAVAERAWRAEAVP